MNDELNGLSDEKLSEVFAVEILGASGFRMSERLEVTDPPDDPVVKLVLDGFGGKSKLPSFATDASAVLPWFEGSEFYISKTVSLVARDRPWSCQIRGYEMVMASTFCRAACFALIRAAREKAKR